MRMRRMPFSLAGPLAGKVKPLHLHTKLICMRYASMWQPHPWDFGAHQTTAVDQSMEIISTQTNVPCRLFQVKMKHFTGSTYERVYSSASQSIKKFLMWHPAPSAYKARLFQNTSHLLDKGTPPQSYSLGGDMYCYGSYSLSLQGCRAGLRRLHQGPAHGKGKEVEKEISKGGGGVSISHTGFMSS